jgi:hypothetical protein
MYVPHLADSTLTYVTEEGIVFGQQPALDESEQGTGKKKAKENEIRRTIVWTFSSQDDRVAPSDGEGKGIGEHYCGWDEE